MAQNIRTFKYSTAFVFSGYNINTAFLTSQTYSAHGTLSQLQLPIHVWKPCWSYLQRPPPNHWAHVQMYGAPWKVSIVFHECRMWLHGAFSSFKVKYNCLFQNLQHSLQPNCTELSVKMNYKPVWWSNQNWKKGRNLLCSFCIFFFPEVVVYNVSFYFSSLTIVWFQQTGWKHSLEF